MADAGGDVGGGGGDAVREKKTREKWRGIYRMRNKSIVRDLGKDESVQAMMER